MPRSALFACLRPGDVIEHEDGQFVIVLEVVDNHVFYAGKDDNGLWTTDDLLSLAWDHWGIHAHQVEEPRDKVQAALNKRGAVRKEGGTLEVEYDHPVAFSGSDEEDRDTEECPRCGTDNPSGTFCACGAPSSRK